MHVAEPSHFEPEPAFRELLERSDDPVFLLNERGHFVYANPACAALVQVDVNVLGAGVEDERLRDLAPPSEVWAGRTVSATARLHETWHVVTFLPIRDAAAQVVAVLGRIEPAHVEPAATTRTADLAERLRQVRRLLDERFQWQHFIAVQPSSLRALAQARLAATSNVPFLLMGEYGTGKRTLARMIQQASPTGAANTFAELDCLMPSDDVLRSQWQLLGLDNPESKGDIGLVYFTNLQGLPRDLQFRLVERLERAPPGQPRICAGVTLESGKDAPRGTYLDSLQVALSTLVITLPPLRERRDEVPLLAQAFLEELLTEGPLTAKTWSSEALALMRDYSWPNNLMELREVTALAARRSQSPAIRVDDLPMPLRAAVAVSKMPAALPPRPLPLDELLENTERNLMKLAMRDAKNNLSKAAQRLGISRARLYRRMQALGLVEGSKQPDAAAAFTAEDQEASEESP